MQIGSLISTFGQRDILIVPSRRNHGKSRNKDPEIAVNVPPTRGGLLTLVIFTMDFQAYIFY
jgi:hypothetical protein